MNSGTATIREDLPETRTSRRPSCGRATASRRTGPVGAGVLFASTRVASWRAHRKRVVPPRADFSTGCKDRQNMAMGAAAAVVVVLLVLYFSLGGSSAEPERIVLTRG